MEPNQLPSGHVVHHSAIGSFKVGSKWAVRLPLTTANLLRIRPLVPVEFKTKKAAVAWMQEALVAARKTQPYIDGTVFADDAVRDMERTLVLENWRPGPRFGC